MEKPFKFILPSPKFDKNDKKEARAKPHFLTASGMLLPREKQPPPMYGKRGATIPARFLQSFAQAEPVKQYCEPCELELSSLEDFKRHRAQHEKCPVDGCQFRGHPSIMDKHVTALHNSGLFDKFKKLSTPEEIAAWRDERRKRYPTVENVLLKQKAQEQRQKRGERLENNKSRFGKQDDRKRALPNSDLKVEADNSQGNLKTNNMPQGNRSKNKRKRRNNREKTAEDSRKSEKNNPNREATETEEAPYNMFRGTLKMKDYTHVNNKKKEPTGNALFSLVGMYGSDDQSEEEENDDEADVGEQDSRRQNLCDNSDMSLNENTDDLKNIQQVDEDFQQVEVCENGSPTSQCEILIQTLPDEVTNINASTANSPPPISNINEECVENTLTQNNQTCGTIGETPPPSFNITLPTTNLNDNSSDEGPQEKPIARSIIEYKIESVKLASPHPSVRSEELPRKQVKLPAENAKTRQSVKRKSGLDYRKLKMRKQNTMLEKLLEADIKHERNVLLQCVRFVCENNFFAAHRR